MGGKAATLRVGDSLIFGDGDRRVIVSEIDFRRGIVKLVGVGPDFIRVERAAKQVHHVTAEPKTK